MPEPTGPSSVCSDGVDPPRPMDEDSGQSMELPQSNGAPLTRSQALQHGGTFRSLPHNGPGSVCTRSSGGVTYLREYQEDGRINVGPDYQAVVPEYNPVKWREEYKAEGKEASRESLRLWVPPPPEKELSDEKLAEFCATAKNGHNFSMEQALGLLQNNEYNVEKALNDLSEYRAMPEEWTAKDDTLFDQAFAFNGKSFRRIKQMMPEKSVADLVEYYYKWKRKRPTQDSYAQYAYKSRACGEGNLDEAIKSDPVLEPCQHCRIPCAQLQDTPNGRVCGSCYLYWRRTGKFREAPTVGSVEVNEGGSSSTNRSPTQPNDLALNAIEFFDATVAPKTDNVCEDTSGWKRRIASLRKLEQTIAQLRVEAQQNRSTISGVGYSRQGNRAKLDDVAYLRVDSKQQRGITTVWSAYETLLAEKGFHRYGKDFAAVAEIVGTKTEEHVRRFYESHKDTLEFMELDEIMDESDDEPAS